MDKENIRFFVHSRCCGAHWELVIYNDGGYDLLCEKCGKSAGSMVIVVGTIEQKCNGCDFHKGSESNG